MWDDLCLALEIDIYEYLTAQSQISRITKLSNIEQQVVLVSSVFLSEINDKIKTVINQHKEIYEG
jgi:hypothetical protein